MSTSLKALVTGGRGFIGSLLVEDLLRRGFEVRCLLRRSPKKASWLEGLDIQVHEGDITDAASLRRAAKDVDYVFHLAGLTKARSREEFYSANVAGTKNLVEAACRYSPGLRRFVLVSSLAAAGPSPDGKLLKETSRPNPVSNYGESKLRAEEVVRAAARKIAVSIVRPPAVFGPRDRDIFEIFKYAKRGLRTLVSGGPRYLSMIYVEDLVRGLVLAATDDIAIGQTYFMANHDFYSWEDFGGKVDQVLGRKSRTIVMPLPVVFLTSCMGELYGKLLNRASLLNLDKYKEIKPTHWICDSSKARKDLGFETQWDLAGAVRETVRWYREKGWL